ncbi:hypothetical protein [Streptomyces sp. NPDC006610]|uniref:hypothetical protein n=1 Tax=Streptomyces sp. NPDC006610 TaxID=3154584 RepID=UPI0033B71BC1
MSATAFEHGTAGTRLDPYAHGDYLLPPPRPADRIAVTADRYDPMAATATPPHRAAVTIDPRDRRRLDLHAALTAAGIPPRPEDREAIEQLAALPGGISASIRRWLHHTTTHPCA